MSTLEQIQSRFREEFGEEAVRAVRAPGRVNLIGEHTDYNNGFALPMAIDRAVRIALRPRTDRRVRLISLDFPEETSFDLDSLVQAGGWGAYVRGMAWSLQAMGLPLNGWEGVLGSDVPVGSGLSSSAAIELAVARAFWSVGSWRWDPVEMARAARRHENEWMGLQSGIMDQLISAVGQEGRAFLIDFRDETFEPVPLPEDVRVVVMDTKVKRGLVDSAYNARVRECRQAAEYFGAASLRDVGEADLLLRGDGLEEALLRRARHVVTENHRVLDAADVLRRGDAAGMGVLMSASHASLRDDYQVSCRELDVMVAIGEEQGGCFGARMTGAGFGGCAVALVAAGREEDFVRRVASGYQEETGIIPELYVCRAAVGAGPVALP